MSYEKFENKIGYVFRDKSLLTEAFTHSSYANELIQRNIPAKSNERLEFLGDAVLEIISSTYLFKEFPDIPEGELTPLRSLIIRTDALSAYAKKIGLGDELLFSKGESRTGRDKDTNLEDAFEALLGAIYLDSGCSVSEVEKFLLPFLKEKAHSSYDAAEITIDCKSRLQQIIQETPGEELKYVVREKSGPDHAPVFTVDALLNSNIIGSGTATSKKQAEQNAAREALKRFFN